MVASREEIKVNRGATAADSAEVRERLLYILKSAGSFTRILLNKLLLLLSCNNISKYYNVTRVIYYYECQYRIK